MKRFFTSGYSPFVLVLLGLLIGLNVIPEHLQKLAAVVGMVGLGVGMTAQVIMQYKEGKCGVHWIVCAVMLFAIVLRGVYLARTGQYWLAIPDIYGALVISVIQLQLAGYFLMKQPSQS